MTGWLSTYPRHKFRRQEAGKLMLKESDKIDALVRNAVFGSEDEKAHARWTIWRWGKRKVCGLPRSTSVHGARPRRRAALYDAGDERPHPSYDTGRAIFRAAKRLDAGAIICEIARSEIAYTDQRPAEYVAVMTAAALREGFTGPLFIQGDHVQVNAKKYAADADAELKALRALIEEELHAGFYNVDIDTSTLVDLSKPNLDEQQRTNYERAAELTQFIRTASGRRHGLGRGGDRRSRRQEQRRARAEGVHGGL